MFKVRDLMMSVLPMTAAQMDEVLRAGDFACDAGCSACTGSCSPCTSCSGCTSCSVTCLSSGRLPLPFFANDEVHELNLKALRDELAGAVA